MRKGERRRRRRWRGWRGVEVTSKGEIKEKTKVTSGTERQSAYMIESEKLRSGD